MGYTKTDINKKKTFGKPTAMLFTRWVETEDSDGNKFYQLGDTTVDLVAVVADSSTLEQGDPSTETIDCEFSDTPLDTVTTSGEWNFSCECIDFQKDVLALYGCDVSADGKVVVFPKQHQNMYCMIHIKFGADKQDVILPFVSMASKATLAQMKSGLAKGVISGTCQNGTLRFFPYSSTPIIENQDPDTKVAEPWIFDDSSAIKVDGKAELESAVFYMEHFSKFYVKDGNTVTSTKDNIKGWAKEFDDPNDIPA